jgi:hypothetical protein
VYGTTFCENFCHQSRNKTEQTEHVREKKKKRDLHKNEKRINIIIDKK